MDEKELLSKWLINLYASLKEINSEIEELERESDYTKKMNQVHISKLDLWLSRDDIDPDVKESLSYYRKASEGIISEKENKLMRLKKREKATLFIIEEVEKELRD